MLLLASSLVLLSIRQRCLAKWLLSKTRVEFIYMPGFNQDNELKKLCVTAVAKIIDKK